MTEVTRYRLFPMLRDYITLDSANNLYALISVLVDTAKEVTVSSRLDDATPEKNGKIVGGEQGAADPVCYGDPAPNGLL